MAALVMAATVGCGQLLGLDEDVARDASSDALQVDGAPVPSTSSTASGVFVSGGVATGTTVTVRGAFSWAPSSTVTSGTTVVSGGFR